MPPLNDRTTDIIFIACLGLAGLGATYLFILGVCQLGKKFKGLCRKIWPLSEEGVQQESELTAFSAAPEEVQTKRKPGRPRKAVTVQ